MFDSHIFLDVVVNAAFLLSALSFFLLTILFADTLVVHFDFKTFLKALGFFLLFGSSFFVTTHWIIAVGLSLLFLGFNLDPFSKFKFISPMPLILLPFLSGHILLFVLGFLTTIVIFQLAYTTSHRDFIPLGVGFTLITVGEYFYHLEKVEQLRNLAAAGSFLYLFASIVLIGWAWSYLAIRFVNFTRSKPEAMNMLNK